MSYTKSKSKNKNPRILLEMKENPDFQWKNRIEGIYSLNPEKELFKYTINICIKFIINSYLYKLYKYI